MTVGHLSIITRALELFDRVVVCIGRNNAKETSEADRKNADHIRRALARIPDVEVMEWDGLTVDAARQIGARWLLRGVRSVADYEYERSLADINRSLSGIDTVILFAEPSLAHISSSLVRELRRFGHDTSALTV
jgi:pantetheine-phosphate adenylyltransferase